MASTEQSNLSASNQLKINIQVITNGQKWARQIHGVYTLLYPWMIGDFVHLDDFKQWLKGYDQHIHGNGNNGSPTTKLQVPVNYTTAKANANLIQTQGVGKIRKGFADATKTISAIANFK